MTDLKEKAELEVVDRGPDWLFVRLHPGEQHDHLADQLWAMLTQHFIYRLVLEMDEVAFLPSTMIGQLVMLHKRVLQHEGTLRLCGLSPQCKEALHLCRLDQALPNFECRTDAVYANLHTKPR